MRKDNLDKIPPWLRKISRVEKMWASLIQTLAGHSNSVVTVVFSPDGKQIASGSTDKTIKLWDTTTGDLQKTLADHLDSVVTVAFSPDGKKIASGSRDKNIKLWDIATGDLQKTLTGHSDSVYTVVFSPDGKQIASESRDETIKLWDITKSLKTSRLLGSTLGRRFKLRASQTIKLSETIDTVKFSADGRYLVTNLGSIRVESILAGGQSPNFEWSDNICVRNQ